jgi:hypothetical protein
LTLSEAYRVLGLSSDATLAEVKAAYRRTAAETHPDQGGTAAEFIRVRAAYEILFAFVKERGPEAAREGARETMAEEVGEEEVPIPDDLRAVIDEIVEEFRRHQRWAEEETLTQLAAFQAQMTSYIETADRNQLRRFSDGFRASWNATLSALFNKCNARSDEILLRYETWYTDSTQAVFDDMYRRDLLSFVRRRLFWEVFLVLGALAGVFTMVIGWGGSRRWLSIAVLVVAFGISFLVYRRSARRRRKVREKAEPLSVVPFVLPENTAFAAEAALRQGRRTTAALGIAGLFLGSAASGGLAVPAFAAVAGAALGNAFDRWMNPTGRMRESLQADLQRFMYAARPQVVRYVLEAHQQLLDDVRVKIVDSYQERVKSTVKLLTGGE